MSHERLKTVIVTPILILCLVLGGVFLCNCHLDTGDSSLSGDTYPGYRIISNKSPYYKEIMSIVMKWKDTVLNKDFNAMISLTEPKDQSWLEMQLGDKASELYRTLYDDQWNQQNGKLSVYEILKSAKKLEIVMVSDMSSERFGYTTGIYFFDKKKNLKLIFPLTIKENEELLRKDIWLLWVYRIEGRWYVNPLLYEE